MVSVFVTKSCHFHLSPSTRSYTSSPGVTKTHRLTYESQSALFPSANPDPGCAIVVSAQAALEWLQHFVSTGRGADVTICASPTDCSVRSKSDDYETGKTRKSIQTEIKVELTEFQLYHVPDPIYLTFPMKEFRASVVMAESLAAPVELHFSQSGEPLFVRVYSEAMNSELVIATSEEKGPPTQTQKASSKSDGAAPPDPEPEMPTSAAVPSRRAAQNNNGPEAAPERSTSLSRHGSPQVSSNHAPAPHVDTEPQTSEAREAAGPLESSQPPASIPQAHTESFPRESTPRQGLLPQSVQASPKLTAVRRMLDSPPERGNAELQPPPSQDDGANDLFLGGVLSQTSQEAPNEAAKRSVQSQYIAHTGRPLSRQNSESNRQRQQQSEPPRKVSASKAQPTDATMQRLDGGIWRAEESIELSIPKHLLEDQRDRRGDHEGARHSVAAREQHTFDVTEDTFDYSQAMDEMERGIEAGSIPVHGASQALGKRSIDEREENAGSVNASKSKDDADDEDDEMLPATQVASQASEAMALSRATRAHPSPQPDLVSSAAVPTPLVTATATPTEREQQQQQRKKFKPMF